MLPLYLLTAAKKQPVLVELKSGETINGQLINCDSWMNLTLKDVIQSSAQGDEFLKIEEIYIRGNHIKYLRLPDELMDYAKEQNLQNQEQRNRNNQKRGRGGFGQNGNYNQNRRNFNQNGGRFTQGNRRYNNNNNNNSNINSNNNQHQSNHHNNVGHNNANKS